MQRAWLLHRRRRLVNALLKAAYVGELQLATDAAARGDHEVSWHHLERAHVLSQAYAWPHVWVHLRMLAAGWRRRDLGEVVGQLVRVVVAAPGSWLGRAPPGNTGGADVGIFAPMAIPEDLQRILAGRQ
jgi:hypothetical protein